jgi:hypothetical protein
LELLEGSIETIDSGKEMVMRKEMLLVVTLVVLGFAGTVLAMGPLGPPTAGLKQGQFGVAAEYAHSDSDVEIEGETLDGLKSNVFLGQIGYGISDVWELYGLVGTADHESDDLEPLDFGYDFAYGFGTKFTFVKEETLSWGVAFEMGWRQGDDSAIVDDIDVDVDLDYFDMVVAVGPTWKAADNVRIYGGPFFYMLDGDLDGTLSADGEEISGSFDIEEESSFGGYIGTEIDLNQNTSWYGEFQFTGDMWVFGTGIGWKF